VLCAKTSELAWACYCSDTAIVVPRRGAARVRVRVGVGVRVRVRVRVRERRLR
jgi:hypothetical protein